MQNLISLVLLRPLRLFVSSPRRRHIRIITLKATHLPFVALIWAYENSRQILRHYAGAPAQGVPREVVSGQLPNSHLSLDPPGHGPYGGRERSALSRPNPLATPTRSALRTADASELLSLIEKLSSQVDALTAMVAGQQKD